MGVQGFPTLKIVKPGKKAGKPIVEDYQGERTAKAIVDAVVDKIPNHVKRLKDGDYQAWIDSGTDSKAILFSDKGTTSALLKAIAVDFLGGIDVAQIRDKETEAVDRFDVEKFPTLVLIPGKGEDSIKYDGEMKKDAMVAFLSQAAAPNPDPAPKKTKSSSSSKSDKSKASKDSASFSKSSESQASKQAKTDKASQTAETLEDQSQPTESPDPKIVQDENQKPVKIPEVVPIQSLVDAESLQRKCLNTKAGTCILALLPDDIHSSPSAQQAVSSLSEIHHKHESAKRNLFPFYQIPVFHPQAEVLRKDLKLGSEIELIATNGKRSWYRHYVKTSFGQAEVEDWIDSIRMGEGLKEKLPEDLIINASDLPPEPVTLDSSKGPAAMREALKAAIPEGVEFEFEEVDDNEYAQIIAEARKSAEAQKAKESEDAKPGSDTEPVEHIIDEL